MDIAKAMYKGGKIIHANECDFSSYKNLGLLCPFCSQEVCLRKGNIRKPYFAHFPTTSSRQVEDCELRASVFGNSTETSNFIEDRGQRLEIFKKHFLEMISVEGEHIYVDLQFNNWMNLLKVNINNITMHCTEFFLTHRQAMEDKYIKDKKRLSQQQQIALEAMNYLCVISNHILLHYILNYSMYKLYNQQYFKLLMQEKSITSIAEICHYAAKIIINNSWIEAFALATDINDNSNIINKNDIKKTQDDKLTGISNLNQMQLTATEVNKVQNPHNYSTSDNVNSNEETSNLITNLTTAQKVNSLLGNLPITFMCYGGKKLNQVLTYTLEVTNRKPYTLTAYFLSTKTIKDENNKESIITIKTPIVVIEAARETLLFKDRNDLLLGNKYAFNMMFGNEEITMALHSQVIQKMAIPYWVNNAHKFVELNNVAPMWVVIGRLILKSQVNDTEGLEDMPVAIPFTVNQFYESLIEAHQLLPNNKALIKAVANIPGQLKSASVQTIETTVEPVTEELPATTKTVNNKFRSGFLNGWSLPFEITLTENDKYAHKFGYEPINVQVCLEANETLVLYRVLDRYYRKDKEVNLLGKNVLQHETKSMTQDRVKMIELASVNTVLIPQMKWLASTPSYELLADQMNRYGKPLPSLLDKFTSNDGKCTLIVTDTQVYAGKRVLAEFKSVGNRLVCQTTINPIHEGIGWIKSLVGNARSKMLQANVTELKKNHIPIITSRTEESNIQRHKVKGMLKNTRNVIRVWQPELTDDQLFRLAQILTEYGVTKLNFSPITWVGFTKALKEDELKYRNFVAEVLATKTEAKTDFYIHLLNYDGKLKLPKDARLPSSGTLFVTFAYKGVANLFKSTNKLEHVYNDPNTKACVFKATLVDGDTITYNGVPIVSYNELVSGKK